MENPLEFKKLAVRALRKDEKNGDVWTHMKTCKACNDYGDLFRKHQMYCDEPGEPCNVNEAYSKDPLEGKIVWQYDENNNPKPAE
jgi:hypothetical protein